MAKFEERLQARKLRRGGESIKDIAKKLEVSKSTVSLWCSDIVLTESQKEKLRAKSISRGAIGREKGALANKKRKEKAVAEAREWAKEKLSGKIKERDLLLIGAALYWAEGSKTKGQFSFVNSDPKMAKLIIDWLKLFAELEEGDFLLRVAINKIHASRIRDVEKYWVDALGIPHNQFYKPAFINTKLKKVYDNHDRYYGMIVIRFRRSTMVKYRLLGLIKEIQESI